MANSHVNATTPLVTGKAYDSLKGVVQLILPALGTLYFTLAQIWGLPYGEEVVGSITAIALFGGVIIGVSKHQYDHSEQKFDGAVNVDNDLDDPYSLEFKKKLEELTQKDQVTLKVNRLSQ